MAWRSCAMDPPGVRMTTPTSCVEDLSKEEALSFAKQVREWFAPARTFADRAGRVLDAHVRTGDGSAS